MKNRLHPGRGTPEPPEHECPDVADKGAGAPLDAHFAVMYDRCKECNRGLKDPVSRKIGFGPVCRAKLGISTAGYAGGKGDEPALTTISEPMQFDVVLTREGPKDGIGGARSNVPWSVIDHSPTGFEWGYGGSGPADLALNILNAFIPPGTEGEDPVECHQGKCSATAARLHQEFKWEFLASMPREGGTIPAEKILNFIYARHERG